ncbi:hypothetical protein GIB67_030453 [Kingdonia uniflora]|uniref:MULE transposase domain-containing protein n=1 Tax=Kingdonia uniflora TaxID=39325 RepID=A0A7J7P719_9MAGN|nr:hypothetical protein GIB67_030453 [Kingdonia uniflora]
MVKKNSKKQSRKMQLRDEVGDDNSNPITVPDNAPEDCPPPEIQEPMLSHIFRPICTDDLRDMWAKGDKSYPMRTQFYIKPTDVVREIPGAEAGEYILLDEDDNDYIISPRETRKKNTTPVKATSVKAIPIDPEEIDAYEIETPVNIVPESESECDDIDEEQDRWVSKENDKDKTPLTVGFKELEVEMQWATGYEAREHMRRGDNTLCNAPWIAREVETLVRDVRAMIPKAIKTRMKTQYGVEISYWTAWNARQICLESIVGSYDQGYHDLPSLCVEILKSNPGSIARTWRQDDTLQWTGTLVAFKASLNGFVKGCRPILGLDGCFLKGKYGGVCLSVLSLDANNDLFPIGVYMCRTECKESLLDFLAKIEPYLSAHSGKLTFISDRQKGLIDSVAEVFPHANHRFCFRHMFKNMKKYHKGAHLERLSWGAAGAFRQNEKQEFLNQLGIDIPGEKDYLEKKPYEHWGGGRPRKERRKGDNEVHKEQKKYGKCGTFGHNKKTCKGEPIQIQSAPAPKARGRPSQKSTRLYFNQSQQSDVTQVQTTPIVGGVQTTPIAGGRGSSGRASNAGRERGRSEGASSGRASNTGRGRGRSECTSSSSNSGRGRGRSEGASSSSQSQERPPLAPRTGAPANPYKKTFKPPRQNWRL